mmetsp:Transcript_4557/g.9935  ORF Transcript_4557/g.9935 Transcript_4557/m.9935 type:complete len:95 (-) Transcript_4557:48-332(-)
MCQTRLDIVQQAGPQIPNWSQGTARELDQGKERLGKADEQLVAACEKTRNRREVKSAAHCTGTRRHGGPNSEETKTRLEEDKATDLALAKEVEL